MQAKFGVLLANLGTPDSYNYLSMRRYLGEFLSDKRIIELNKWLWYPILYGIILNRRPWKSGRNYRNIWDSKGPNTGSPLLYYTKQQALRLSQILGPNYKISYGMRYGAPNIAKAIQELDGCEHILLLPLFPQYSATTTASIFDAAFKQFTKMRNIPAITTIKSFATNPIYIKSIAASIRSHLGKINFKAERILVSFHGIPQAYCDKGDPYAEECRKSFDALQAQLPNEKLILCFQSRFGKAQWIQPYLKDVIQNLKNENITKIAVICPGFMSDCLETIDEIDREIRAEFIAAGGKEFAFIPCLNDDEDAINLLADICKKYLPAYTASSL